MALPLILGLGAAFVGVLGLANSLTDGVKIKGDKIDLRKDQNNHEVNMSAKEKKLNEIAVAMNDLGKNELYSLRHLEVLPKVLKQIEDRAKLKEYEKNGISIPKCSLKKIKRAAQGTGVLLAQIEDQPLKSAADIAAAGAANAAYEVAKKAKAADAFFPEQKSAAEIAGSNDCFENLRLSALKYDEVISQVDGVYLGCLSKLVEIIQAKSDWSLFSKEERIVYRNTTCLASLLLLLCSTSLVVQLDRDGELQIVNVEQVERRIANAQGFLENRNF